MNVGNTIIVKVDVEGTEPCVVSEVALTLFLHVKIIALLIEVWHRDVIENLISLGMKYPHLQEFLTRSNNSYVACVKLES